MPATSNGNHDQQAVITWDYPMLMRFELAIAQAKRKGDEQFTFEENVFLTTYAAYLAEFLEQKLN